MKQATSTAWFFSLIFSRHGSPRQSRQFFLHLPRLSTRVFSHGVYFLTSGRHRQLLCHLPSPPVFHYTTIHALVSLLDPWLDHFSHDDDAIHFSLDQRPQKSWFFPCLHCLNACIRRTPSKILCHLPSPLLFTTGFPLPIDACAYLFHVLFILFLSSQRPQF